MARITNRNSTGNAANLATPSTGGCVNAVGGLHNVLLQVPALEKSGDPSRREVLPTLACSVNI